VHRLIATTPRLRWLAVLGCVVALMASAPAVEKHHLRSGMPKVERLPEAQSMKLHELERHRPSKVAPQLQRKHEFPGRYTRKNEGVKRMKR
jgi:hypothetical protein